MGAGIKSPSIPDVDRGSCFSSDASGKRRVRWSALPCTASEHVALGTFLTEIFGSNYSKRFQASLDDPFYEPCDRLLLRRRTGQIVAHHTYRAAQHAVRPAGASGRQPRRLGDRGRLPGTRLGHAPAPGRRAQMAESGAMIGLLRTRLPYFFRRTGWALCGGDLRGKANPHCILAAVGTRLGAPHVENPSPPLAALEEDAIARIYRQNMPGSFGLLERSRCYWHWLLERRGYDQFYVALDGPDLWDLKESSTQVVGYAAIRGEKIIELMTAPGRKRALMELLARACGDAIEQDHRQIVLHAAANSSALEYFHGGPEFRRFRSANRAKSAWPGCSIPSGC